MNKPSQPKRLLLAEMQRRRDLAADRAYFDQLPSLTDQPRIKILSEQDFARWKNYQRRVEELWT